MLHLNSYTRRFSLSSLNHQSEPSITKSRSFISVKSPRPNQTLFPVNFSLSSALSFRSNPKFPLRTIPLLEFRCELLDLEARELKSSIFRRKIELHEVDLHMEGALEQQEENVESKSNGDDFEKNFESDPLIYQLVRVEGDGTMIPATEDEVMQFVDLGNMDSFLSSELIKSDLEQGFSQPENTNMDTENPNTVVTSDETKPTNTQPPPEIPTEPNPSEKTDSTSPSANDIVPPVPDFSLLQKDEISLDGLSIRELQVLFLSTFGRKTNVKDKSWLKRRIAMGLTNSSEVPTSNFTIKNNKIVVVKETVVVQQEEGNGNEIIKCKSPSPSLDSKDSAKKRPRNNSNSNNSNNLEKDVGNSEEDTGTGTGTQKRMRKPTKRYIEELSDLDNKDASAPKSRVSDRSSRNSRSRARIESGIGSWVPALRTRSDSLGGFRVQVPFTSRARRCRPRKNFISFMLQNGLFAVDAKTAKEKEKENEPVLIRKIKTPVLNTPKPNPEDQEPTAEVKLEIPEAELDESEDDNTASDDNNESPTANSNSNSNSNSNKGGSRKRGGGMRRKHHRAWTLCEVLKLVEGVSRYGAGRWSEIRRLVFASYSYRTSVDLKDKWRNLLRAASLAQPSVEREGKNARKPASMPIPKSILSRVRELAELHSQTGNEFPGPKNPGNKIPGLNGGKKVVQGKGGSGFL